jgi:hypothetical protein
MGQPSYMRSVVDRNVVMRCLTITPGHMANWTTRVSTWLSTCDWVKMSLQLQCDKTPCLLDWRVWRDTDGIVSQITSLTSCRPYWIYTCYIYSKTAYGVTRGKHEWRQTSTPRKCSCRASGKSWTGHVILQKLTQDVTRQKGRLQNHYSPISRDNEAFQCDRNVVTRRTITFALRPPLSGHNEILKFQLTDRRELKPGLQGRWRRRVALGWPALLVLSQEKAASHLARRDIPQYLTAHSGYYVKFSHDSSLPNPLQFITGCSSYISTPYATQYECR